MIILFVILFFYVAFKNKDNFLKSIRNLIKSFLHIKILLPIVLLAVYSAFVLLVINNFYNIANISLKNLIIWFIFTAIALMFGLTNISRDKNFFKNIVIKNLIILAFIEYVLNLFSFSLIAELFLQFGISLSSVLVLVASKEEKYQKVKNLFNFLLLFLVILIVIKSVGGIVSNFGSQLFVDFLLNFIIPIILTISIIPFLYLMAVFVQYELLFVRLPYALNINKDKKTEFILRKRTFLKYGLNLKKIIGVTNEDLNSINLDLLKQ